MRTVGQILKEEREAKYYTLEQVERHTKIRKELLQALESDNFAKLPPPTFIQGFIKNYGKFLGLDVEKLLAVFRREYSERTNPPKVMDAWKNPLQTTRFRMTPTKVVSTVIIGLVLVFFSYLWFEYRFLVGPPTLLVNNPIDQATVLTPDVNISGQTEPEAKVEINNQQVLVDGNGYFNQPIKLRNGVTKIEITATSKFGQTAKLERTVYLKE